MSETLANVRPVKDRHGKIRYRFRRKGWPSTYLKGEPGTAEYYASYAALIAAGPSAAPAPVAVAKPTPRSLDDLLVRLKSSARWQAQKPTTQQVYGRMLERFLDRVDRKGRRYGERPVESVTVAWLDNVLSGMSETPAAANNLRKALKRLMDRAIKLGWRTDNPAKATDTYREGAGYHTWTEDEIETYRKHHKLGTTARLVLELALNTAARRCEVASITRDDIQNGWIAVDHAKNNEDTAVPLLPMTKAAIDALPAQPFKHLVVGKRGKPYSVAGLGNMMRGWCNEAGLSHCSMHGLRKAMSRRVAESGGTDAEGQAITGHKKSETFAYYRAKANRRDLAGRAMSNVATMFDAGNG